MKDNGRIVPVELTSMSLNSPRPLGTQPSDFIAPRPLPDFSEEQDTRHVGSIRPNSYPFIITDETAKAWDHVLRRAMQREVQKGSYQHI